MRRTLCFFRIYLLISFVIFEMTLEICLLVIIAKKVHPVTSRTRKLSSSAPMVLGGQLPGRVGHCQETFHFKYLSTDYTISRGSYMINPQTYLQKMKIEGEIELIRKKDGISLFQVCRTQAKYVLKIFENLEFTREIDNYHLLHEFGIPTIPLIASSEDAILLEDLNVSPNLRLASEVDLASLQIATCLAVWYQNLHAIDLDALKLRGLKFYSELDYFSLANINELISFLGSKTPPTIVEIKNHFSEISQKLLLTRKCLTYNDFYYTNMAVARDGSYALMFDYNLLGVGFAAMDLNNVTSSLSEEAGRAFLEAYGQIDSMETRLNEIVSPIIGLVMGMNRKSLPKWFFEELEELNLPEFQTKLELLL